MAISEEWLNMRQLPFIIIDAVAARASTIAVRTYAIVLVHFRLVVIQMTARACLRIRVSVGNGLSVVGMTIRAS
jgi:hypothetical protein